MACWQLCKELSKKSVNIKFIVPYLSDHSTDFMDIVSISNLKPSEIWGVYDEIGREYGALGKVNNVFDLEQHYYSQIDKHVNDKFDVIHAHDWITFRAALRASKISSKKFIAHVHSIESDRAGNRKGNPLVHELEELGLKNADHIVAVSEFTKQKIASEYAIPLDKITVAHNGIDPDAIDPLDENNAYKYLNDMKQHGYKVVCNVGRLTIQKGLYNFLHAAAKVVQVEPKTFFLIVGSGDQERELISLSADLGIGKNVFFTGFQRGKNWRDAFAVADLFVLPSVSEPFGLTPLEAAAYNTPSLVSKQSGVIEIFNNCLKVDSWDIDEMANSIASLVRHDPLAEELRKNAYNEFAALNWSKTADKLINLYHQHKSEAVLV